MNSRKTCDSQLLDSRNWNRSYSNVPPHVCIWMWSGVFIVHYNWQRGTCKDWTTAAHLTIQDKILLTLVSRGQVFWTIVRLSRKLIFQASFPVNAFCHLLVPEYPQMTVLNLVLGGTIFTVGGNYSPVNNVLGGQYSLMNNVWGTIWGGYTVHCDNATVSNKSHYAHETQIVLVGNRQYINSLCVILLAWVWRASRQEVSMRSARYICW